MFEVLQWIGNESHCGIWPTRYAWNFLPFFLSNTKSKWFTTGCELIKQFQGGILAEDLIFPQLDQKFTREGSLLCSRESSICPSPQQDQSVHVISSSFFKTHSNIILPSTSRSSMRSLSFKCPHQPLHAFLFYPIRARCDFIRYTASTMKLIRRIPGYISLALQQKFIKLLQNKDVCSRRNFNFASHIPYKWKRNW